MEAPLKGESKHSPWKTISYNNLYNMKPLEFSRIISSDLTDVKGEILLQPLIQSLGIFLGRFCRIWNSYNILYFLMCISHEFRLNLHKFIVKVVYFVVKY